MKALNPKTGLFETIYVKAIDGLPIGTILEYPTTDSTKLPDGYLYCDGSAVSRTTYSELFNIIGTSWGAGDGSTTFNLPNKAGLVTIGIKSSDSDFNTIGKTGGSKTHTHEYGLAYAGAYRDTVIENDDQAGVLNYNSDGTFTMNNGKSAAYGQYDIQVNGGFTASTQTATALTHYMATGNASYASTVQPYNISNYIIKAKSVVPVAATVSNVSNDATNKVYSCNYINNNFVPLDSYGNIVLGSVETTTARDLLLVNDKHSMACIVNAYGNAGLWSNTASKWIISCSATGEVNVGNDSGWINATYENGWSNYGGSYASAQYRKIGKMVYLQGLVKNSAATNAAIFTLPAGYRPARNQIFICVCSGGSCRIDVYPSGIVCVSQYWSNAPTFYDYTSLQNISFSID